MTTTSAHDKVSSTPCISTEWARKQSSDLGCSASAPTLGEGGGIAASGGGEAASDPGGEGAQMVGASSPHPWSRRML